MQQTRRNFHGEAEWTGLGRKARQRRVVSVPWSRSTLSYNEAIMLTTMFTPAPVVETSFALSVKKNLF
jgi:hypothetical protein